MDFFPKMNVPLVCYSFIVEENCDEKLINIDGKF